MTKYHVPYDQIQFLILTIRKQKVMLDRDLAELCVETKQLNQQVKRNISRFPRDFMFRLTKKEKEEVVTNCDHLENLKYSKALPYAFTEHGAIMLASVLNSTRAVKTSIVIVRAFVHLRKFLVDHELLSKKIEELELKYDSKFSVVFKMLKQLIDKPNPPRKQIGFIRKTN